MTGLPLLLLLLLAHMLGDFVFQSSAWIDERYEKHLFSKRLYAHAAIHCALSLTVLWSLLMPSWQSLGFAALIGITHFAIDLAKSYTPPGRISWFLIDQLLHLLVIGFVWLAISNQWNLLEHAAELALNVDTLLILTAYFVAIWPFSIVIGLVARHGRQNLKGLSL